MDTAAARGLTSRFSDLRLAVKILFAVGLAALVAVIVGVVGLRALGGSTHVANDINDQNVAGLQAAASMEAGIAAMRIQAREALIRQDAEYDAANQAFDDGYQAFETAAADYSGLDLSADKRAALQTLEEATKSYHDTAVDVLPQFSSKNDIAGWTNAFDSQVAPLSEDMKAAMADLTGIEKTSAAAAAADVQSTYASSRNLVIGVLVLGTALALLLGWLIARALARSVGKVKDVADAMAAGDLSKTAGVTTRDEVGTMATSLDAANTSLRQLMTSVTASADGVASA
ncbi:MCP four helix bundle domain-containing protein, partial [Nocardioides flavescens]